MSKHREAPVGAASANVGGHGSPTWSAVAPLLAALGTSVGLIGFVVFFGGAILWTQADAEQLPASEVVALMPRTVLLSTGAHFLVAALLLALVGVGILWAYDVALRDYLLRKPAREERTRDEPLDELRRRLAFAEEEHKAALETAKREADTHLEALKAAAAAPDNRVFWGAVEEAQRRRRSTDRDLSEAETELKRVNGEAQDEMPALEQRTEDARKRRESREDWTRLPPLGLVFFLPAAFFTAVVSIAWYDRLAVVAFGALTISLSLIIYAETKRFLWFGISAFVTIGLYIGLVTYFRTHGSPEAEPAAALIDGRAPVEGYFVAQTSDRIYFGIPESASEPSSMIALRRNDVVALAIGRLTLTRGDRAFHMAQELGAGLCADLSAGQPKRFAAASTDSRPLCPSASTNSPASHLAARASSEASATPRSSPRTASR